MTENIEPTNVIQVCFQPEFFIEVQQLTKDRGHFHAKKALMEYGYIESVAECVMRRIMKWGW